MDVRVAVSHARGCVRSGGGIEVASGDASPTAHSGSRSAGLLAQAVADPAGEVLGYCRGPVVGGVVAAGELAFRAPEASTERGTRVEHLAGGPAASLFPLREEAKDGMGTCVWEAR